MLNEKKEFEEYLYEIASAENPATRIKFSTLLKGAMETDGKWKIPYNGFARVLTVLARGLLFESEETFEKLTLSERGFLAKAGQMLWMGREVKCANVEELQLLNLIKSRHPAIEGWFGQYLNEVMLKKKQGSGDAVKKICGCIDDLPRKGMDLGKDAMAQKLQAGYKDITYEDMTYNALVQGPPRIYALCCKTPGFSGIQRKTGKQKTNIKKPGKLLAADKDRILKLTAACLLAMRRINVKNCGRARFVPINFMDITNWALRDGVLESEDFCYAYRKKPLFEFTVQGGNQGKAKINAEWLEECQWELLDITEGSLPIREYLQKHPGYTVYLDEGSGKELAEYKD